LGTKNPKNDPLLRGKADYVLEVERKVVWVVEAKAPSVDIGSNEMEQAWSYANHPEIRAAYFALCNGKTLQIYQVNKGPKCGPVANFRYEEFREKLEVIRNVLGPKALLRDFPDVSPDLAEPIGPGLRSLVRIASGIIRYEKNSLNSSVLNDIQITVVSGAVQRNEDNKLIAYLRTIVPVQSLQALNEKLGLDEFEMTSDDKTISNDKNKQTIFKYSRSIILPVGEKVLDLSTWKTIDLPINIRCDVKAQASGFLQANKFSGKFITCLKYSTMNTEIQVSGSFEMVAA
jgi:hypothetical protein